MLLASIVDSGLASRVAELILKNPEFSLRLASPVNRVFVEALERVGVENAWDLIIEAVHTLIEVTAARVGRKPHVDRWKLMEWLASWREPEGNMKMLTLMVSHRLRIISRMLEGEYWVDRVAENYIIITNGDGCKYRVEDGVITPSLGELQPPEA